MADSLHLHISQIDAEGKSRRLTHIRSSDAPEIEIFHEFDRLIPHPDETVVDGHVLAVLLYAAAKGKPLIVHGAVSRSALRNIDQLLAVWSLWRPSQYQRIEVIPDRIVDAAKRGNGTAICAYSGGVDATTTVLRHTSLLASDVRHRLISGMVVHGFDINLAEEIVFKDFFARVSPLPDSVGIDLRVVRTNSKEIEIQDWEHSHALELAACLHMCGDEFDYALIASSARYDQLEVPWGSHPLTDPLMSGDRLTIVHDGADLSRPEKIGLIAENDIALRFLKVCYVGGNRSNNCGKCGKCLKTQLGFVLAGINGIPPCFEKALDINLVRRIQLRNDFQWRSLICLITHAETHNISGPWLPPLKRIVTSWRRTRGRRSFVQRAAGFVVRKLTGRKDWRGPAQDISTD